MTNEEIKAFIEHLLKQTASRITAETVGELYKQYVEILLSEGIIVSETESPITEAFLKQLHTRTVAQKQKEIDELVAAERIEQLGNLLDGEVFSLEQLTTALPVTMRAPLIDRAKKSADKKRKVKTVSVKARVSVDPCTGAVSKPVTVKPKPRSIPSDPCSSSSYSSRSPCG